MYISLQHAHSFNTVNMNLILSVIQKADLSSHEQKGEVRPSMTILYATGMSGDISDMLAKSLTTEVSSPLSWEATESQLTSKYY